MPVVKGNEATSDYRIHISNRELERCLMLESGGCSYENDTNTKYKMSLSCDVILHSSALAKHLLGCFNVNIGPDPRKQKLLSPRDFGAARALITSDDPSRKQKLRDLEREEEEYLRTQSEFNPQAWEAVIELEDRIMNRAQALAQIGLVETNIDNIAPDAAMERDIMLGGSGKIPLVGTISLTYEGKKFLTSGKTLRRKPNFRGPEEEEEVEVNE